MTKTMITRIRTAVLMTLLVGMQATAQPVPAVGPNPALDPPQVVEAMLAAVKKNTEQGIAELFRFSSPRNREQSGPYERFSVMIREGFPDMLGHRSARMAPALIDGDRAMLPVEIVGSDNQTHRYVFLLSRQPGPECEGCWMADAVFNPEAEGAEPAPEYPT
ncbi:MAG: DUF4864 domain-containing protein [Panacagrimonas sp.]